jgi:hypothetical protein
MTQLDSLAIGLVIGVLLYFTVVRLARLLVAQQNRRASAARARAAFAAVTERVYRARPRGGFDMPPQDFIRKKLVDDVVLGGNPAPMIVLHGGLKA